jgi:HEAT repeat protein
MRTFLVGAASVSLVLGLSFTARGDRARYFIERLKAPGFKVRLQAAYVLGTLGDRRAVGPLIAALKDSHYAVRASAAGALGRIGDPASLTGLLAACGDEEPWVRAESVRALGRLKAREALPRLIAALEDSDSQVRLLSVQSLGALGDHSAVIPLARVLEAGTERPELLEAARAALVRLAPLIEVDEMVRRLKAGGDKHDRARAALILGALRDARAVGPLIEALSDRESYVRGTSALALANAGDARALEALKALLDREIDARVRSIVHLSVSRLRRTLGLP